MTEVYIKYFDRQGDYRIEKLGENPLIITYDWILENIEKNNETAIEYEEWLLREKSADPTSDKGIV